MSCSYGPWTRVIRSVAASISHQMPGLSEIVPWFSVGSLLEWASPGPSLRVYGRKSSRGRIDQDWMPTQLWAQMQRYNLTRVIVPVIRGWSGAEWTSSYFFLGWVWWGSKCCCLQHLCDFWGCCPRCVGVFEEMQSSSERNTSPTRFNFMPYLQSQ